MKKIYYFKQTSYILLLLFSILGIYFILGYFKNDEMVRYGKENASVFITADGLITTSTFAFVAFASLSPSSSGSSVVIRRLDWKGHWIFRYPWLLGISVVLTVTSVLTIWWNPPFLIASVIISSIILISIIIKYAWFHKDAEKRAANRFNYIIKNIEKPTAKNMDKFRSILRPLINPLKGTHNMDLLRQILSKDIMMDSLVNKYKMAHINITSKKEDIKEFKGLTEDNISANIIVKRLYVPTVYGTLTDEEKHYLAATLTIKFTKVLAKTMKKQKKVDITKFIIAELFLINSNEKAINVFFEKTAKIWKILGI